MTNAYKSISSNLSEEMKYSPSERPICVIISGYEDGKSPEECLYELGMPYKTVINDKLVIANLSPIQLRKLDKDYSIFSIDILQK